MIRDCRRGKTEFRIQEGAAQFSYQFLESIGLCTESIGKVTRYTVLRSAPMGQLVQGDTIKFKAMSQLIIATEPAPGRKAESLAG